MKTYSKAARLKFKREFGLAETPKRKARGTPRMKELNRQREVDPDPPRPALSARCRLMGIPDTEDNRLAMRSPAISEPAGRALSLFDGGRHSKVLWLVWTEMTRAYDTYCMMCLSSSRHAKAMALAITPTDKFEDRADIKPDPRSEEEKARDAKNAWAGYRRRLAALPQHQRQAIWDVIRDDVQPEQLADVALTTRGVIFAGAVLALAGRRDGIKAVE